MEIKNYIEQFVEESRDIIEHGSVDCEEIADNLIEYLRSKNISAQKLRIEPEDYNEFVLNLVVLEHGEPKEYAYHYVVVINDIVIDMRNLTFFITLDKYKEEVNNLNKNKKIKYIFE